MLSPVEQGHGEHVCKLFLDRSSSYAGSSILPLQIRNRVAVALVGLFLLTCCADPTLATAYTQTVSRPEVKINRDAAALAVIAKAIDAMGGTAAFAAVADTTTEATCTKASASKTDTHAVRWITAGKYFRYDGGDSDQRGMVSGPNGVLRIGDGNAKGINTRSARALRPIYLPGLLLLEEIKNPKIEIDLIPSGSDTGATATHIRIIDTVASEESMEPVQEDWYFDPQTGLPIRVIYEAQAFNSLTRFTRITVEYTSYQADKDLTMPTVIQRTFESGPTTTCKVSKFSVNTHPDSTIFSNTGRR